MSKQRIYPSRQRRVEGLFGARFDVVEEQLNGGEWRTISIAGRIRIVSAPRRSMRYVLPGRNGLEDRGHLIGHQFGGPSALNSGNIVPMDYMRNEAGDWYQYESLVAQFLGGNSAWMAVSVQYGPHPCRPVGFRAEVMLDNGMRMPHKTKNYNLALDDLLSPERVAEWGVNDPANFNR